MNREILFRGKRKDNGEWIESVTLFNPDKCLYMAKTAWGEVTYDMQHNVKSIIGKSPFFVEVIPETVGQYTGLKDKNGRKIFEGDIIKHKEMTYEVKYSTEQARFIAILTNGVFNPVAFQDCKVIGDIHNTPELLEVEK